MLRDSLFSEVYPRLYFICDAHKITKIEVDKWVEKIRYDINCLEHGFCDSIDMIQIGIKNVIVRLEKHFDSINSTITIKQFLKEDYEHIFMRSYDYQHGYLSFLVGWRYAPVLRAMILSEVND